MKCLLLIAFVMPCITAVSGCKCKKTTNEEAYCEAKWISHLKVLEKKQSHDRLTTIYTVEHIDIFKKPDADLPTEFITPSFSGSCGISALKPGEEYLLTGTVANGFELRAVSCLFFNVEGSNLLGAVEWKAVPASIKDLLSKNKPVCSAGRESA